MKSLIKEILKSFLTQNTIYKIKKLNNKKELIKWEQNGYPAPPPHIVKQMTIKEYQEKYNIDTLIETGTFLGDMVEAQKKKFKKIYSIELSEKLFNMATKRFKNDKNVVILQGDSGKILPQILTNITTPAIFWLDGHYSSGITAKGDKDSPIIEELDAIFNTSKLEHILLIDDARFFNGKGDYPDIDNLIQHIKGYNEKYQVEVKHDIIRCVVIPK